MRYPRQYYRYPLKHIRQLRVVVQLRKMWVPARFAHCNSRRLQQYYNGIGPDRWSNRFRGLMTRLLDILEAPALVHDYEYSLRNKSYKAFTIANLRLCVNSWRDRRFIVGLAAAVLCQLFGFSGYLKGGGK